jgi:hypothetical protein
MGRDRFNVTAPASTFATPVAALSFSGADYSQGIGAGSGALIGTRIMYMLTHCV